MMMKNCSVLLSYSNRGLCLFVLLLVVTTATLAQTVEETATAVLSPEVLESRVEQLQESSAFDEPTRIAALELYQRALRNLANAASHDEAAEAFSQSISSAPAETESLRSAIAERQETDPLDSLAVTADSTVNDIEELLRSERGAEAAARARVAEFRQKLSSENARPQAVRDRVSAATEELREVTERMSQPDVTNEPEMLAEARRIARQTTDTALRAEIGKLDQEILSHPVRVVLLQAQADEAALIFEQQQARVRALQTMLSEKRRDETRRILANLGLETLDADVSNELIVQLIRVNGELATELDELAISVEALTTGNQEAERLLEEMQQRFERALRRLEAAGIGQALGRYLAQERRELPSPTDYRRESSLRESQISEFSVRNISLMEQLDAVRDAETYVDAKLAEIPEDEAQVLRPALVSLVESQSGLLQQLIALHRSYLRLLADSGYTQSQLFEVVSEYRDFIAEHLMWVRSRGAFGSADIIGLPGELAAFFAPDRWAEAARIFVDRAGHSPLLITALLFLLLFYWRRTALRNRLRAMSAKVGKPSEDSFRHTIHAVALTILIALPWPVFVAVTGYEISNVAEASIEARSIGTGLLGLSPIFMALYWFRMLCIRGGVAEGHFRWAPEGVAILRRQLYLLTPALLVPAFGVLVNREIDETTASSGLSQILLLILAIALIVFFYRLLQPNTGIAHRLRRRSTMAIVRFPRLSIALATLFPLAVGIMSLSGFMYSAGALLRKTLYTALILFLVLIVRELIVRWLLVVKRRLLLQQALQRREAAARKASGETAPSDPGPESIEDSVEDIASLDTDTRKLVNVALFIGLTLVLTGIWSSILPALGVFRDVTLWQFVVIVGGEETLKAVTLIHLFVAIVVGVVTIIAARNVPSLIEIVLRQWPSINAGSRLAFSTLARYAIATVGTVGTLSILGVNWAKLQWLVAGLSVGIGFGLREIIANFVSGLIILIERPIRVGDMVTVGEQTGTVTRIQIRATTLRNWDRQELLVPNKDFIASHVLNWSLSDEVIRVFVTVGVAYGSDVERSLRLIEEAAVEHPAVLADPEPLVTFEQFGDNALVLGLRCFVQTLDIRLQVQTDLLRAINNKFNEAGIVIAFPQRDLHLDTASPLEVRLLQGATPD